MSKTSFPRQYFPAEVLYEPPVNAKVTARALLILKLREIHAAGVAGRDVNPVLLLDSESAPAAAWRLGRAGLKFNLDDLFTATGTSRHVAAEPRPEHSVELLAITGGTGESHEDNRDMVGVA